MNTNLPKSSGLGAQNSENDPAKDLTDLVEVDGKFVPVRPPMGLAALLRAHLVLAFFPYAITRHMPDRSAVSNTQIDRIWVPLFALFAMASVVLYSIVIPMDASWNSDTADLLMTHAASQLLSVFLLAVVGRLLLGNTLTSIYMGVSIGSDVTRSVIEAVTHAAGMANAGEVFTSRALFSTWEVLATLIAFVAVVQKAGGFRGFVATR